TTKSLTLWIAAVSRFDWIAIGSKSVVLRYRMQNPSPPFRGEREGPARASAWEGEVGSAADWGIGPPHPTLSPRPAGAEARMAGDDGEGSYRLRHAGPACVTSRRNLRMSQAPVGQRSAHRPQCRQTSSSLAMMRPVLSELPI